METIFHLEPFKSSSYILFDEMELGLRAAVALFVENETDESNFVRVMKWHAKWGN